MLFILIFGNGCWSTIFLVTSFTTQSGYGESSLSDCSTYLTNTFHSITFFLFAVQSLNIWSSFFLFLESACRIHLPIDMYMCIYIYISPYQIWHQKVSALISQLVIIVSSLLCYHRNADRGSSPYFSPLALSINVLNPLEGFSVFYTTK